MWKAINYCTSYMRTMSLGVDYSPPCIIWPFTTLLSWAHTPPYTNIFSEFALVLEFSLSTDRNMSLLTSSDFGLKSPSQWRLSESIWLMQWLSTFLYLFHCLFFPVVLPTNEYSISTYIILSYFLYYLILLTNKILNMTLFMAWMDM